MHGQADAASPVPQTLSVQNVVAGTSNTAGANFTIAGSKGTGTGAGGSILFQTAPAGSTGTAQNAEVTALSVSPTGHVGIGTSTPAVPLHINLNTVTNLSNFAPTTTYLWITSADGLAGGATILTDSYGDSSGLIGRRSDNTAASPTALAANDQIYLVGAGGYGSTGFTSTTRARVAFFANQTWTDTNQGTYMTLETTPNNSVTKNEVLRILAAGNIQFSNAASFSANGSVATSLGSIGPVGSHTTVQTWLTFVDSAGTTRYVPAF